eukprot:COSAG04_NODE_1004_length_8828_cov_2.256357_2_plen_185_part_00
MPPPPPPPPAAPPPPPAADSARAGKQHASSAGGGRADLLNAIAGQPKLKKVQTQDKSGPQVSGGGVGGGGSQVKSSTPQSSPERVIHPAGDLFAEMAQKKQFRKAAEGGSEGGRRSVEHPAAPRRPRPEPEPEPAGAQTMNASQFMKRTQWPDQKQAPPRRVSLPPAAPPAAPPPRTPPPHGQG